MNGKNGGEIKKRGDYTANAVRKIWSEFDKYPNLNEITIYGLVDPIEDTERVRDMETYISGIHFGLASADKQGKHIKPINVEGNLVNRKTLRGFDAKTLEETYGIAIDMELDKDLVDRLSEFLDNHQTGGFLYFGLSDDTMMVLRNPKNDDSNCNVKLDETSPYPETDAIADSL